MSLTKQYLGDPSTFGVLLPFATTLIGSLGFTKHTFFIKHIGVNYFKINAKIAVRIHFIKKIKNILDTDQNKNILTDVSKCTYIFILVSVKCIVYFFTSKLIKGFDWLRAVSTTEIPQSLALTIPYDYPTQPHLIIV